MNETKNCDKNPKNNITEKTLKSHRKTQKSTRFSNVFKICTDYDLDNFTSFNSFTKWLHRPVDASALGVFRMLYGKYKQKENQGNFIQKIIIILLSFVFRSWHFNRHG